MLSEMDGASHSRDVGSKKGVLAPVHESPQVHLLQTKTSLQAEILVKANKVLQAVTIILGMSTQFMKKF